MSDQVIFFGENLEAHLTDVFRLWLHIMCLLHVAFQIKKLFLTHGASLFWLAGFEDLMADPQVLVEVGNLLATFRTGVSGLQVHKLCVWVMIRLFVGPVVTILAAVSRSGGRGGLINILRRCILSGNIYIIWSNSCSFDKTFKIWREHRLCKTFTLVCTLHQLNVFLTKNIYCTI